MRRVAWTRVWLHVYCCRAWTPRECWQALHGGALLACRRAAAVNGGRFRALFVAGHAFLRNGSASLLDWGRVTPTDLFVCVRRLIVLWCVPSSSCAGHLFCHRALEWSLTHPSLFPVCVAGRPATVPGCSYLYMAPEVVRHTTYSFKADTFSYAILVNEIFSDERPYGHLLPMHAAIGVVKKGLRPSQKRIHNPQLRALLAACWDVSPDKRPDWDIIISTLEELRDASVGPDTKSSRRTVRASGRMHALGSSHSSGTSSSSSSGVSRLLRKLAVSGPTEGKRA